MRKGKEKEKKSICPFCGCGCRLKFIVKGNKIVKIEGDESDYMSEGKPCVKALVLHEMYDGARYERPLIRKGAKGAKGKERKFKAVSWNEALKFVYKNLKDLAPDEVLFIGSGKTTNENNYVLEKFARILGYSIDNCCSRICHQATTNALLEHFGNPNLTKLSELDSIDTLLIIGSNPATNYPVFFNKILKGKEKQGIKLIGISSFLNETLKACDLKLIISPGTDYVLLNGIIAQLLERKAYAIDIEKIENFAELKENAKQFRKQFVCEICKITEQDFDKVVDAIAQAKSLGVTHGMGFTQHIYGHDNLHSLLNLAILKRAKLFNLRGEVNVQGSGDMACSPERLPTNGLASLPLLEKAWHEKLYPKIGKNLIEAIFENPVKAIVLIEFNPAQSLPNLNYVHKVLRHTFLVCMQSCKNLTAEQFADVILPIPLLFEEEGTITNGERRVRKVERVVKPSKQVLSPWQILSKLAKMFRLKHFNYKSAREIFNEIISIIPDYRGLEKVWEGEDLYASKEPKFVKFVPVSFKGIETIRSKKYPFILVTFRSKWHFLTDELTSQSKTLKKFFKEAFFINPNDAKRLNLRDNDRIIVKSETGQIRGKVKLSAEIPEGIVAAPFYSKKLLINKIVPSRFDPSTFTPDFKSVAVSIEKAKKAREGREGGKK
ncbi:MAG: molybdopterin-dependent oxidoreductase [Candidatus Pacearchaeota archaeon]